MFFTSSCTPRSTWHTWVTGCPTDSEEDKKDSAKSFFGSAHGWQLTKNCNSITMTGSCPSSGLTIYSRFATISGCLLKCSMSYSTISMQDWRGRAHTTGGPWYLAIKLAVTIRHLAPGDKYSSLSRTMRSSAALLLWVVGENLYRTSNGSGASHTLLAPWMTHMLWYVVFPTLWFLQLHRVRFHCPKELVDAQYRFNWEWPYVRCTNI